MSNIILTWDADGSIESFSVYRAEQTIDISNLPTPIVTGITDKTYIDNDVVDDRTYFYRVASNKGNQQKISDEVSIKTTSFTEYADTYMELKNSIIDSGLKPKTFTSENLIFENEAAVFSGSTSISSTSSNDFAFETSDFTIEAMIQSKSGGTVFDFRETSSGRYDGAITINETNTWIGFTNGSSWFGVDVSLSNESFYHIALTRSSNVLRWFIDGKKVAESSDSTNFSQARSLCIGKTKANSSSYFKGVIKKVRITNGLAKYINDFELTYQN